MVWFRSVAFEGKRAGRLEEFEPVFTMPVGMLEKISVTLKLQVTLLDFHF